MLSFTRGKKRVIALNNDFVVVAQDKQKFVQLDRGSILKGFFK